MGILDLFAKEVFKEEIKAATGGACTWEVPRPIHFKEVHADGLLHVVKGSQLATLPAPWNLIDGDEVVFELKMMGDHIDAGQWYKALLRRQAREVNRSLTAQRTKKDPWIGYLPLWIVSGYVPDWITKVHKVISITEGISRVSGFPFVAFWVSANDLPLREDLIPFLVARTGTPRKEFVRWVTRLRHDDPSWVARMLGVYKMTLTMEELREWVKPETEEDRKWQKDFVRTVNQAFPVELEQIEKEAREESLRLLLHMFERRLGRHLREDEQQTLMTRFSNIGADRLGDVILDLSPEDLVAWLADSQAT